MRRLTALLGLALLLASAPASGSPRRHENVTRLGENERRRLPTVLSNQRVGMDGQVDDLFLFAQYGEVPGRVDDNVYAFCQSLELSGTVGGDVYAFCQTLRIRGQVEGDVYVGGGELLLEPGAAIGGCLLGGVGEGSLEGRVDGPVKLGAGELWLNGELLSEAELEVGSLRLGPAALLRGRVQYEADGPATLDPNARVEGDFIYREHVTLREDDAPATHADAGWRFPWKGTLLFAWRVLSLFILGAVLLAVGGARARRPSERLAARPGLSLGVGFVVGVTLPAASLIAMLLILPLPLGLVGLLTYAIGLALAGPVVGLWLGERLLALAGRAPSGAPGYGSLALGILAIALLGLVPYLGWLVRILVLLAGLGALSLALWRKGQVTPAPALL